MNKYGSAIFQAKKYMYNYITIVFLAKGHAARPRLCPHKRGQKKIKIHLRKSASLICEICVNPKPYRIKVIVPALFRAFPSSHTVLNT